MTIASPTIAALRVDGSAFWIDLVGAPSAVRVDRRTAAVRFSDPQRLIHDLKRESLDLPEPYLFKAYYNGQNMEIWVDYRAQNLEGREVLHNSCIGNSARHAEVQEWVAQVNRLIDTLGVALDH